MSKKALQFRELLERLKPYNIKVMTKRGKGSERILIQPSPDDPRKGPQFPIKHHGQSTAISIPVVNAVLRRFNIDQEDFWK